VATPTVQRAEVVRNFKQAWQAKDVGALVGLLDPSVTATADGGGLVSASVEPIGGGPQVASYLVQLAERAGDLDLVERTVNGQPGLVALEDGTVVAVYAFEIAADRIHRMWVVRNPEKLRIWA
jgi:RNA polymerase sigma-70 factor (ECF subfamily)